MSSSVRRPMSAALKTVDDLTPEALAFIKEGTPKPQVKGPVMATPESTTDLQKEEEVHQPPKVFKQKLAVEKEELAPVAGVVGLRSSKSSGRRLSICCFR